VPLIFRPKLKPQANPYPSRFQRWRYSFGVALALSLLAVAGLRIYKPLYNFVQEELFERVSRIQGSFLQPFQEMHTLWDGTFAFLKLKKEYERLKKENEELKWQLQTLKVLKHENHILKQNLKVPAFEKYGHLTARILANPYDGIHHFFLIAAGQKEGIKKDQAVVVREGVVGRLEKVGSHVARVLLLNDVGSRIPVMILPSQQKAILAGDGTFFPDLVYIGDIHKVQQGEEVVTSGLGGIFPASLPLGVVHKVANGKIKVRPYVSFQDLEWVHILKVNSDECLTELHSALEEE